MARDRPLIAVLVILLHLALLALLLMQRVQRDAQRAAPALLHVSLGTSDAESPVPLPVSVTMQSPSMVQPILPEVVQPPEAITVPVQAISAATPAGRAGGDGGPVLVQAADYIRQPFLDRYPPGAKRRREQGTVMIAVRVGTDGVPRDAQVYRSSGFQELDQGAIQAVYNALFRPRLVNGVPQEVWALVPINFFLTQADK